MMSRMEPLALGQFSGVILPSDDVWVFSSRPFCDSVRIGERSKPILILALTLSLKCLPEKNIVSATNLDTRLTVCISELHNSGVLGERYVRQRNVGQQP
jgi:hypothetical protein